ncbi:MAG: damage-inducible protein DinB [Cyclobacteriaceae bacterium]|nr:damage-inducible protein DinB [Cyclobacteriaceae bacterium]
MTQTQQETKPVITPTQLLEHWQGHRALTRRVIEAFPEKELFNYSIGGMRTCAALIQELLAIAVPGLRQIALESTEKLDEDSKDINSKGNLLQLWDEATPELNRLWALIPEEKFQQPTVTFGQYEGTVWSSILYFIDNEIHHRGQAYVYLRSLGIEPPYFWER